MFSYLFEPLNELTLIYGERSVMIFDLSVWLLMSGSLMPGLLMSVLCVVCCVWFLTRLNNNY